MFIGRTCIFEVMKNINTSPLSLSQKEEYNKFKANKSSYSHYPYQLERDLLEAVSINDYDRFEELVSEFAKYPPANLCKDDEIRSLKNNLICNCTIFTRIMLTAGVDEDLAFYLSDSYINKIEQVHSLEELSSLGAIMLGEFMSHTKETSKKQSYSSTTKQALKHIELNLCKPITLEGVSDELNVNSCYLSRIFKSEVGTSFVKYIHSLRIQKAKQMLLLNDESIIDIAIELGYSNQSHFTRVFKKDVGITPQQFRKNVLTNTSI